MPASVMTVAAKSANPGESVIQVMNYIPKIERNVGDVERVVSMGLAGLLAAYGLGGRRIEPFSLLASGYLLYRGLSGNCPMRQAVVNTAGKEQNGATVIPAREGVRVEHSITINRPASELYRFWHDFSQLPRFMSHLKEVRNHGNHTHWIAKGPMGISVEWKAEIITDTPNETISWRSLPGSDIDTSGSVHFIPVAGGTQLRVNLKYDPPAGKVGHAIAKMFGRDARTEVEADLARFKEMMESGRGVATMGRSTASH